MDTEYRATYESGTGFRCNRKGFGLTYSCPRNEDDNPITESQQIVDKLLSIGAAEWLVGKELHASGKTHWHAMVLYDDPISTTNCRNWDVNGVHCNILKGAPGKGWINYCKKEKEWRSSPKFAAEEVPCHFQIAMSMPTANAAIEHLWENH